MSELNWLPNHLLKDITLPKVKYVDENNLPYSGYYAHESKVLTVATCYEELVPSTIAHEFKHYLQEVKGTLGNNPPSWKIYEDKFGYEKGIKNYFKYNKSEYEALLFEYKYAKDWCNEWWIRELVLK